MTPDQYKKMQEETKQMEAAKKWIDTFTKMDISRQQSGLGSLNRAPARDEDITDKVSRMMEKKLELETMTKLMQDIYNPESQKKGSDVSANVMQAFTSLLAQDPDGAKAFLEGLDENAIQKLSILANPDPNAQVLRSLVSAGNQKKGTDLETMLSVFAKLTEMQRNNGGNANNDPNQAMMMTIMTKLLETTLNKPQDNSQNQLMIEMMRSQTEQAREAARQAEERARANSEKFNQLMITVLNDKVQEARQTPGLIDQLQHLGQSMELMKNMGLAGNTGSKSLEELKMSHEMEKWRTEQQMNRAQGEMWKGLLEQGLDRVADIMSTPAVTEFAASAGGRVSGKIAEIQQNGGYQPQHPSQPVDMPQRSNLAGQGQPLQSEASVDPFANPTSLVTFGDINEQEIPINVPSTYNFGGEENN